MIGVESAPLTSYLGHTTRTECSSHRLRHPRCFHTCKDDQPLATCWPGKYSHHRSQDRIFCMQNVHRIFCMHDRTPSSCSSYARVHQLKCFETTYNTFVVKCTVSTLNNFDVAWNVNSTLIAEQAAPHHANNRPAELTFCDEYEWLVSKRQGQLLTSAPTRVTVIKLRFFPEQSLHSSSMWSLKHFQLQPAGQRTIRANRDRCGPTEKAYAEATSLGIIGARKNFPALNSTTRMPKNWGPQNNFHVTIRNTSSVLHHLKYSRFVIIFSLLCMLPSITKYFKMQKTSDMLQYMWWCELPQVSSFTP